MALPDLVDEVVLVHGHQGALEVRLAGIIDEQRHGVRCTAPLGQLHCLFLNENILNFETAGFHYISEVSQYRWLIS